jgi:glucosamine-phosphate N-acetyltransferase
MEFIFDNLKVEDYNLYLSLLENLTEVNKENITLEDFKKRINETLDIVHIIRYDNKIVASGSLFIMKKFVHCLGNVGQIEDIIVDPNYRGLGLGKKIINYLVEKAKDANCYKVILNSKESNVNFYKKIGFEIKEHQMVQYL